MNNKEINPDETALPLAYFLTFTCYGTWLHGAKEISVDRNHNELETAYLLKNKQRQISVEKSMREPPYFLDAVRRDIVLKAIKEVSEYRSWDLLAAHIRTNHVHIVIHAGDKPELIVNSFKAYASRFLNKSALDQNRLNRWTRHGSTRYLWKADHVEAAIQYVIEQRGEKMAFYENIERTLKSHDFL